MHNGDVDAPRIEQQVEPGAVQADHHDLGVAGELPAPALECHDDRAFVSIIARDHAPTLTAQIFTPRDPGPRRDLLGAAADRGSDDDSVATFEVCENHLRADRVDEVDLTCTQRIECRGMTGQVDKLGIETLRAQITAFNSGKQRRDARTAMRRPDPDFVHGRALRHIVTGVDVDGMAIDPLCGIGGEEQRRPHQRVGRQ
jgi:hypothetical protein